MDYNGLKDHRTSMTLDNLRMVHFHEKYDPE